MSRSGNRSANLRVPRGGDQGFVLPPSCRCRPGDDDKSHDCVLCRIALTVGLKDLTVFTLRRLEPLVEQVELLNLGIPEEKFVGIDESNDVVIKASLQRLVNGFFLAINQSVQRFRDSVATQLGYTGGLPFILGEDIPEGNQEETLQRNAAVGFQRAHKHSQHLFVLGKALKEFMRLVHILVDQVDPSKMEHGTLLHRVTQDNVVEESNLNPARYLQVDCGTLRDTYEEFKEGDGLDTAIRCFAYFGIEVDEAEIFDFDATPEVLQEACQYVQNKEIQLPPFAR